MKAHDGVHPALQEVCDLEKGAEAAVGQKDVCRAQAIPERAQQHALVHMLGGVRQMQ